MVDKIEIPSVAKEQMNEVHREEAELIGYLLEKIKSGSNDDITKAIEKLLEHMKEHFEYEEGMLKNRGFAMYDIHRNDHARIMGETRMAYMNWRNFKDKDALKEFIEDEFLEWLNLHIQAMDSVAAEFLVNLDGS
ncbi:MAG: hemerythrin family protein [Hydrogenimonas sp.]|nr:hemerythrin family protein [Hydrogenimonas sp.]